MVGFRIIFALPSFIIIPPDDFGLGSFIDIVFVVLLGVWLNMILAHEALEIWIDAERLKLRNSLAGVSCCAKQTTTQVFIKLKNFGFCLLRISALLTFTFN